MFKLCLGLVFIVIVNTVVSIFVEYSWEISSWNPSFIITISECCKCIISVVLYSLQPQPISLTNVKIWAIPGLMYTALNTLTAFAFKYLPAHFIITVANLRIVFSMVFSTYCLKQTFTRQQWLAGIVILFGLFIIYLNPVDEGPTKMQFAILFGILSGLLSAGSGVVCEYLYFTDPEESIHAQNMKLYFFGIIFNFLSFLANSKGVGKFHWTQAVLVFQYVFAGITVAFILKYLGNVVRNIIGALTVVSVTIASQVFLGNKITSNFIEGACFVIAGTMMFYFGKQNKDLEIEISEDEEKN